MFLQLYPNVLSPKAHVSTASGYPFLLKKQTFKNECCVKYNRLRLQASKKRFKKILMASYIISGHLYFLPIFGVSEYVFSVQIKSGRGGQISFLLCKHYDNLLCSIANFFR